MSSAPSIPPSAIRRKPSRKARLAALLVILGLSSLFVPAVFQFLLRQCIALEAWRNDATVQVGEVQGSIVEPITIRDLQWTQTSRGGVVLRLEIARADAEFSSRWRELLSGSGGRWFRRLVVDGVTGKIELPPVSGSHTARNQASKTPKARWAPSLAWIVPERIEAENVDFTIESNGDSVAVEGSGGLFSQVEPGTIRARKVVVKQPWLTRTFRDLTGATAIQDSSAAIANLVLEQGIVLRSLSADLPELGQGRLDASIQVDGFGGTMRAQIRTLDDPLGSGIDASGSFSQIGVAPLATFLSLSDAAGGTIKEGQFTFRGTPRNVGKASGSVGFTATNFQWESRQWDSLIVGATLVDGRLEVPELELRQGHNQVSINGQLTLPPPQSHWWQSEFAINLSARIGNLTELSALMLPEFKYAAGRVSIDGGVQGQKEQFHGAVIVSGSGITWRNAPIEDLRAAIRLNGNELNIANLDLINKDDFVRGSGVINILGPKQYWGEFRASVADLATYAAILQKPIVPEPLAGGAVIDWSGEGSAKGHSGKFSAHLNKLRTLGATGAMLHPVNAELEGDYSPDVLLFSRFAVSDDESSFTANVTVGKKVLTLASLRLTHRDDVWLEGNAVLPLDVWQSWPNASLETLLSDQTPGKVSLTVHGLQLRPAAQLTGWKWPVEGVLNGSIDGEGTLGALATSGHLSLKDGHVPLGWSGNFLTAAEGEFNLAGQVLSVEKFHCNAPEQGDFTAEGAIDFSNIRDPSLHLALRSPLFSLSVFSGLVYQAQPEPGAKNSFDEQRVDGMAAEAGLDLEIAGPASAAVVTGTATLASISFGGTPDLTPFWLDSEPRRLPPLFTWRSLPWKDWKFAIDCRGSIPGAMLEGARSVELGDLQLTGTGASPALVGSAHLENVPVLAGTSPFLVEEAAITFREGFPDDPSILATARGRVLDCTVTGYAAGPVSHCIRFFDCDPPLTPEKFRSELAAPSDGVPPPVTGVEWLQHGPVALTGDVRIYDWSIPSSSDSGASSPAGAPAKPDAVQ